VVLVDHARIKAPHNQHICLNIAYLIHGSSGSLSTLSWWVLQPCVRCLNLTFRATDGGGVRGLSSLYILQQLMQRINPEAPPRPCDYFDMICGTSTGGYVTAARLITMALMIKASSPLCWDALKWTSLHVSKLIPTFPTQSFARLLTEPRGKEMCKPDLTQMHSNVPSRILSLNKVSTKMPC
jgi:hypothetical protein